MHIEIKIPKEISEYQESVFFGLSLRQFVCSLLAVAAAAELIFNLLVLVGAIKASDRIVKEMMGL